MASRLTLGKPGHGMTFRGAMKPVSLSGSDGRSMMTIVHIVELRCGTQQVAGMWCDVWVAQGKPHARAEFASQAADALRRTGATCRIRPVLL